MKRYAIADLVVDMEVSGRTQRQAAAYETTVSGPADITLECDVRGVLALNPRLGTEEVAEYMGTGLMFAQELLSFNGSFLHASAVLLDGKAYLFSAASGTGKSTHTEKWCRLFGAQLLNDDKPVVRRENGCWIAYGTPWSGKHDLSIPAGVPLAAIACLRRGEENKIRRMTAYEALPYLLSQSLRYLTAEQMSAQLALLDKLMEEIPVWELICRNDDEAAFLSYANMR